MPRIVYGNRDIYVWPDVPRIEVVHSYAPMPKLTEMLVRRQGSLWVDVYIQ